MKVLISLSVPKRPIVLDAYREKQQKSIFFNQSIPISELKNLGEIDTIPEECDHISELKS